VTNVTITYTVYFIDYWPSGTYTLFVNSNAVDTYTYASGTFGSSLCGDSEYNDYYLTRSVTVIFEEMTESFEAEFTFYQGDSSIVAPYAFGIKDFEAVGRNECSDGCNECRRIGGDKETREFVCIDCADDDDCVEYEVLSDNYAAVEKGWRNSDKGIIFD